MRDWFENLSKHTFVHPSCCSKFHYRLATLSCRHCFKELECFEHFRFVLANVNKNTLGVVVNERHKISILLEAVHTCHYDGVLASFLTVVSRAKFVYTSFSLLYILHRITALTSVTV